MQTVAMTARFFARQLIAVLSLGFVILLAFQLRPAAALDFPVALDVAVIDQEGGAATVAMTFDKTAQLSHQLLDTPSRLVLDFETIGYGFSPDTGSWDGLVNSVRWGDMSAGSSRVIFQMSEAFTVNEIRWVELAENNEKRLEIDVAPTTAQAFQDEIDRTLKTGSIATASKTDRLGAQPLLGTHRSDEFIVVIDAGHGGIDSGAIGKSGTLEKDVTLTFAKELKPLVEALGDVKVYMTRDRDVFKPLGDRVRFARERGASLFVSVHADSVRQSYVRGATVYTISDRASDAVAAEVAASENLSDEIAGIVVEDESSEVVDILVDLARRETHGFSVQFARLAIDEIGQVARLINNAHRYAGFRVLKAPDVPSVLLELGYLSNEEDEKLLNDPQWRAKMAGTLTEAIARFAELSGHEVALNE